MKELGKDQLEKLSEVKALLALQDEGGSTHLLSTVKEITGTTLSVLASLIRDSNIPRIERKDIDKYLSNLKGGYIKALKVSSIKELFGTNIDVHSSLTKTILSAAGVKDTDINFIEDAPVECSQPIEDLEDTKNTEDLEDIENIKMGSRILGAVNRNVTASVLRESQKIDTRGEDMKNEENKKDGQGNGIKDQASLPMNSAPMHASQTQGGYGHMNSAPMNTQTQGGYGHTSGNNANGNFNSPRTGCYTQSTIFDSPLEKAQESRVIPIDDIADILRANGKMLPPSVKFVVDTKDVKAYFDELTAKVVEDPNRKDRKIEIITATMIQTFGKSEEVLAEVIKMNGLLPVIKVIVDEQDMGSNIDIPDEAAIGSVKSISEFIKTHPYLFPIVKVNQDLISHGVADSICDVQKLALYASNADRRLFNPSIKDGYEVETYISVNHASRTDVIIVTAKKKKFF